MYQAVTSFGPLRLGASGLGNPPLRVLAVFLIAVFAVSTSGCWAWKCGVNYSLNTEEDANVGEAMVSVEEFLEHKRTQQRYDAPHEGTWKEELIYTGKSGSTIGVTYREYANDFARPAFFQDLRYDLDDSRIIVFRKWRMRVLDANNQHIRFVVLDDAGGCAAQPLPAK